MCKKSGGSSGSSSSDDSSTGSSNIGPQKVYIVGYAVTEKSIYYDCPKSKAVFWDLGGNMTVLNDSCDPAVDMVKGVAVDSSDNIYVTGYTEGGLDGNTSSGKKDFFLAKYNASGTKEWTKQQGSSADDYGNGIAVDSSDNIYVTGNNLGRTRRENQIILLQSSNSKGQQ